MRNIGIDDSEFVAPGDPAGHVHVYAGQDANSASGNASAVAGGNTWQETHQWWTSVANLAKYDIVFNACGCKLNDLNQDADGGDVYQAMHDYLDGGGRLFATHYFYKWLSPPNAPTDFQSVVHWASPGSPPFSFAGYFIDTSSPKGKAFADWAQAQVLSTTYGQLDLQDTHYDTNGTTAAADGLIYGAATASSTVRATIMLTFDTPVGAPAGQQCGRVVLSDVHLSGASDDSPFPLECTHADPGAMHAPNEQAMEFAFFDAFSCPR